MALKDFFFYLVCNSNSQKKINLVWIWAASCLTYSPHIYGYYVSKGTKISAGYRSGPFQSQNTCVASIPKVLFYYFQKYLNRNDKYFKKRNMNPLTQTHTHMHTHKDINTHTYIHTNTHTHTHTHTHIYLQIMERTLHCSYLNLIPISLCYVCYVMYYYY